MSNYTDTCKTLCLHYGRRAMQMSKGETEKSYAVRLEQVVLILFYRIQLMIKILRKPEMEGNVRNLKMASRNTANTFPMFKD